VAARVIEQAFHTSPSLRSLWAEETRGSRGCAEKFGIPVDDWAGEINQGAIREALMDRRLQVAQALPMTQTIRGKRMMTTVHCVLSEALY
jgi:hypothetical protein